MRIYTLVEYQWDGKAYVKTAAEFYEHTGPVALCTGAEAAPAVAEGSKAAAEFGTSLTAADAASGAAMTAFASGAETLPAIAAAEGAVFSGAAGAGNLLNTLKPYGTAVSGAASVASGLKTLMTPNAARVAPGMPAVLPATPMPTFDDDAARAARREFMIRRGSGLSRENTVLTGERLGG